MVIYLFEFKNVMFSIILLKKCVDFDLKKDKTQTLNKTLLNTSFNLLSHIRLKIEQYCFSTYLMYFIFVI